MPELIRLNSVHALAVVNPAGVPQDTDDVPSAHLSLDDDGNLRTSAVAVIGGSVEISNDVGNPVPVNGTVEITNDVGNPIPVNGTVTANAGVGPWPVTDNGGSLTVDGAVTTTPTLTDTVPTQITKTVAATGTPEALAANGTFFKSATLIANNAARTPNTGKVWLGVTAGDGTQPIGLDPGDIYEINAPEGQRYDLNDWYLDVETAADGAVVIYS